MIDESIYEVTRDDYKGFVNEIKPEFRDIRVEDIGVSHIAAKIYSKKTGKCLCSRVGVKPDSGFEGPEKYYIFEMPDNDERRAPTPVYKLQLETKEEVQAFFDFINKQKEKENDGTIS